jgi:hypothetical protein
VFQDGRNLSMKKLEKKKKFSRQKKKKKNFYLFNRIFGPVCFLLRGQCHKTFWREKALFSLVRMSMPAMPAWLTGIDRKWIDCWC